MPFEFQRLKIPEVILITSRKFEDSRGFFTEIYKQSAFEEAGIDDGFMQDNHSFSESGVLRGLHYQLKPDAQAKLVRCLQGEIFDVAVDIRKGSPYYGAWVGKYLTGENGRMLYVPEGFAHGFLVTGERAHVAYKVSSEYAPESEAGLIWNDPEVDVEWPLEDSPKLSEKDSKLPSLKEAKNNFNYDRR